MQKITGLLPKGDFATCEKHVADEFGNTSFCGRKAEYVDAEQYDDETDEVEPARYYCEKHAEKEK